MKFRNYVPHDKDLQEGKIAPAVLPKFEDPVAAAPPPEKEVLDLFSSLNNHDQCSGRSQWCSGVNLLYFWLNSQDPFLNIAPKKPNWDLRRDVQKKLDKLEKRTQKALFKLMGKWLTFGMTFYFLVGIQFQLQ